MNKENIQKQIELSYLAGFFDGEGSIFLAKNKPRGSSVNYIYHLVVSAGNKNYEVLKKLKDLFGGSIYKCSDVYKWGTTTRQAQLAAKTLKPYLIIKRKQAELAERIYEILDFSPMHEHCRREHGYYRSKLTPAEVNRREEMYQEFKRLNKENSKMSEAMI